MIGLLVISRFNKGTACQSIVPRYYKIKNINLKKFTVDYLGNYKNPKYSEIFSCSIQY